MQIIQHKKMTQSKNKQIRALIIIYRIMMVKRVIGSFLRKLQTSFLCFSFLLASELSFTVVTRYLWNGTNIPTVYLVHYNNIQVGIYL